MTKSLIIVYDPKTNIIKNAKFGDFDMLISIVETFTIVAMRMHEKVLFFKVEDDEKVYANYLIDYSNQNISYLDNFKNAKYKSEKGKP